ncbi:uncharacterized protein EV420DRAFT_1652507 [Desarmillaria tabescens]|uniref:Ribonuclease H1 N-terminal domain-containing protein n=1 Tax=Armillaria tabescens TaxID=1929756 RepID=A0AA39MIU0_ARMTA|nr:uncharacterized protein EV420DRAFT_1652507 [Desarmillaria tabescens]KAK0436471.1 hypothetical protein EV420DRAFT_1652507 [Desarmillaria tabescens]
MPQQSQPNLTPQALVALLEVLNVLNLNTNNASTSTPASTSAPGEPEGEPAPAPVAESTQGAVAGSTVTSPSLAQAPVTSGASSNMPGVVLHPFTRIPLLPSMQPGRWLSSSHVPPTQQPPVQVHSGFHCSHCGAFNPTVGQSSEAWYVVTAGHEVDIFFNWEVIQPLVSGVAHACHRKYKTHAEAKEAFQMALSQGKVCVL